VRREGGIDEAVDLVSTEHVGQGVAAGDLELLQCGPVAGGDAAIEESAEEGRRTGRVSPAAQAAYLNKPVR
jgi:hypothetical protein